MVTLRRSRRPERQMAAYQRHLLRMQKRRSSVAAAGVEAAAAAAAAAGAGAGGGASPEEAGATPPPQLAQATQKQPAHKARPKVVTHWGKMPGEEEKAGEKKVEKDKKEEGGKKEKRKGTAKRVTTGKGKTDDAASKEKGSDTEKQKKKKPKKKVRMSDDTTEIVSTEKTSASKWAGIHAALRLWHREPVPADQLESVPVPGPDGEERRVTLRRPPPITLAFEGLSGEEALSSKLEERVDGWRARAHASAAWPALSAQLVASLLTEVVDEESAELLQDQLADELARRLVDRVLDRARLVAYNRYEHAEAVKHIFLSNMGNIVPAEREK